MAATTAGALPSPASGVRTWGTLTDGPPDAEAGDKRGGRPAGGGCSSGWLTAPCPIPRKNTTSDAARLGVGLTGSGIRGGGALRASC